MLGNYSTYHLCRFRNVQCNSGTKKFHKFEYSIHFVCDPKSPFLYPVYLVIEISVMKHPD